MRRAEILQEQSKHFQSWTYVQTVCYAKLVGIIENERFVKLFLPLCQCLAVNPGKLLFLCTSKVTKEYE